MTAKPEVISIVLADDHPVVREGLRSCLAARPNLRVVGEAEDGQAVVSAVRTLKPDVVLMDVNMPGVNGLIAAKRLKALAPKTRILFLSVHNHVEYVSQMIRIGAHGYVSKDAAPDELVYAIERVAAGDVHFGAEATTHFLRERATLRGRSGVDRLSAREQQVLACVAEGMSNKETAARLGVGVRTVETLRDRIKTKLGIRTIAGLTRYALSNQIRFTSG